MHVEISDLPMFEELSYARKHAEELSQADLGALEHRIDTIEEYLICLTDVATDSLRRSIEDEEFEIGSTMAANSLTLLSGLQRYVCNTRNLLKDLSAEQTSAT